MATVRSNLGRYHGKLLKDCTEFVLAKFCPNLSQKININYIGISRLKQTENITADCCAIDRDYRGREFEIRIDKALFRGTKNVVPLIETVMHELVHVKQCALGEHYSMFHKESGKIVWKWQGDIYDYDDLDDEVNEAYWEQPWEVESFGRQYGLMRMFFTQNPHWAVELKIDDN